MAQGGIEDGVDQGSSQSGADEEEENVEAPIWVPDEDRLISHIDWLHERAVLPDALAMLHWQEGGYAWRLLKRALEKGDLGALVRADQTTVAFDKRWVAYLAPFDDGAELRIEGGGQFRFDASEPAARDLGVPSKVDLISFKIADLERLWPLAVRHKAGGWRRPHQEPRSETVKRVALEVTERDYALLAEAIELVGEWIKQDAHPAWSATGSAAWLTVRRGIQVENLKVDGMVDGIAKPFDWRWVDFIARKGDAEFSVEGGGHVWFDKAKALEAGVVGVPNRISTLTFAVKDLDRIWPGCTGVAQPPKRSIFVGQSLSRHPTTAEQPTAGEVALPQAKSAPNAPRGRPSAKPIIFGIIAELEKEDPRNKHMNPGELASLISKRLPPPTSIRHETIVRIVGEIRGTRRPPGKSKKH